MTAANGAEDMGMDEQAVVKGRELYVKFTLDAQGELFLISFKENEG